MEETGDHLNQKPVIFLAIANDREDINLYLRNLSKELDGIRNVLQKAEQHGLCELVERSNATLENILDVFQNDRYHDRIAMFHYGGHADSYKLLLETIEGNQAAAYREGLVHFLAKQKGLNLVFLNGCSSQRHALELTRAGISAVIGTSQSIADDVATNLSIRFYNGIANSFTIERAWNEAIDDINTRKGTSNFRDLYRPGKNEIEDRFPWDIFYKEGGEKAKDWNLPEAANDPLFGLPEVSDTYSLPETPFFFLNRYERKQAKLFFGRSVYIRELYNRITDPKSPPIILLYGQSGVGKSSLLDAGLMPRIEETHTAIYIRRIPKKGLTGSLEENLQRNFPGIEGLTLEEKWKQIESQTGKPLVAILDQAEEVYTHTNKGLPNEFRDFMETLKKLFGNPALYPGGKLILGYRKEYHPEIDKIFRVYELPRSWVYLEPLNRRDIIEVVTGLTRTSELMQRYNIKVDKDLPVIIADDLLEDKNSPVAPILQILLTKMWNRSKKDEFTLTREFTVVQYQELKRQGFAMKDFFDQQMEKLQSWKREVVDSGLALDILNYHTTELGTTCSRSIEELRRTYENRLYILEKLIEKLKHFYLLTDVQQGKAVTSLAHDTMAPVVIKEYTNSNKPGQRAVRILTTKAGNGESDENQVWLDGADLKIVEEGRKGMRTLNDKEEKLLEISRKYKQRREKVRKRLNTIAAVLIVMIFITSIVAVLQRNIAQKEKKRAEENLVKAIAIRLAVLAKEKVKEDPTIALRIAEKAWRLDKNKTTALRIAEKTWRFDENKTVIATINKIYRENSFYKIVAKHKEKINSVAIAPDGQSALTGSADNTARLWDRQGKLLGEFNGHNFEITSVAFSPDGNNILTGSGDCTIRLWNRRGEMLQEFNGHTDRVSSVAFSPDGKTILSGSWDNTARLWDRGGKLIKKIRAHKSKVFSTVFSPDGNNILTGSADNTARLWDLRGKRLQQFNGHNSIVSSVAFSPDGTIILTGSWDNTARLWDRQGYQLQELKGHTHWVSSVSFSPDGKAILTGSWDNTARIWDWQGNILHELRGHKSPVLSAAFLPDGKNIITGSLDKTTRLWWGPKMPLEDFLRKDLCEGLSKKQLKEYGIEY